MRVCVRSELSDKVFVLLSGDDVQETSSSVGVVSNGLPNRTIMNQEYLVASTYGILSKGMPESDRVTLYPWSQILWVDGDPSDLQ
jgi:hypothetical protein